MSNLKAWPILSRAHYVVRLKVPLTPLTEAICLRCGYSIGYAPTEAALDVATEAHILHQHAAESWGSPERFTRRAA